MKNVSILNKNSHDNEKYKLKKESKTPYKNVKKNVRFWKWSTTFFAVPLHSSNPRTKRPSYMNFPNLKLTFSYAQLPSSIFKIKTLLKCVTHSWNFLNSILELFLECGIIKNSYPLRVMKHRKLFHVTLY